MKNYIEKVKRKRVTELVSIKCDVCHKVYDIGDTFEVQEFHHIKFMGGYGSVFGDEAWVECDICQHCLKKLIGDYCRVEQE